MIEAHNRRRLEVTTVEGPAPIDEGDVLVPQIGPTFSPSDRNPHPSDERGGSWIDFVNTRSGGIGRIRIDDGVYFDALDQISVIEAEPV